MVDPSKKKKDKKKSVLESFNSGKNCHLSGAQNLTKFEDNCRQSLYRSFYRVIQLVKFCEENENLTRGPKLYPEKKKPKCNKARKKFLIRIRFIKIQKKQKKKK